MTLSKNNGQQPEDIHPDWMNVVRAAQAECSKQKGFGVMTIVVAVNGTVPVFWNPIMRQRLHPKRAAEIEMTPQIALSLMSVMDMHRDEMVVLPDDELT